MVDGPCETAPGGETIRDRIAVDTNVGVVELVSAKQVQAPYAHK